MQNQGSREVADWRSEEETHKMSLEHFCDTWKQVTKNY